MVDGLTAKIDAITMFVSDVGRSKAFYSDVFGRQPIYEDDSAVAFEFDNVVVNLLRSDEPARELIAPAEVGSPETGARFVLTLPVEDVDGVVGGLATMGLPLLNGPMDRPWGIRTASFMDPDGHIWEVAHSLKRE